ncbi:polyketide synthase [Leptospira perolatii]|uniref:Polyketide synthase n=1 Tax=Leptospira perolatii TaxID=2023191 RepID=A0A2M9ZLP8_9LEPT|nr:SDR family oxidoreductase [Leptospira perolatii]PJZ70382.1 polyketide synthase [Leptospira perolatii]PJZ72935.1 polyketide synthase [Leptospira perolatii]
MNLELGNKKVIISGSSRGIGLAVAKAFLSEGANVGLIARGREKLESVYLQLKAEFGVQRVSMYLADTTNSIEVRSAIKYFESNLGGVDILVANVGDGRSVKDPLPSEDRFLQTWNINFRSSEIVVRESLDLLRAAKGVILFIGSIAGLESIGAPTDYSVAKSALLTLSKNLARKLAPEIRVNCINPGNVFFPGGSWEEKQKMDPDLVNKIIQDSVPMKRFGSPEEIADSVLFLCSDRAKFITGACLTIDGGQTVSYH